MARTTPSRYPDRVTRDRPALDALLDGTVLGHVGLVVDDAPVVIPTGIARDGDRVLLHGSTGSGWMRRVAAGAPICLEVTALDAVVVARTGFESSFRCRSALLFGSCTPLDGDDKVAGLARITDRLIPGRAAEVRASSRKELAATLLLALPIEEWTLKASQNWPDDLAEDVAGDAWAGIVPVREVYGPALPAPDLRDGIPVPASVTGLVEHGRG